MKHEHIVSDFCPIRLKNRLKIFSKEILIKILTLEFFANKKNSTKNFSEKFSVKKIALKLEIFWKLTFSFWDALEPFQHVKLSIPVQNLINSVMPKDRILTNLFKSSDLDPFYPFSNMKDSTTKKMKLEREKSQSFQEFFPIYSFHSD